MDKNNPTPINDERLTADMKRIRNGSTMLFYVSGNRSNQPEDADISIEAPRRELLAKLIRDNWYWVNDCPECSGETPMWAYVKCDVHNVCIKCKTPRGELTETPWGHQLGFICKPCHDAEHLASKMEALEKFKINDHDEWYFNSTSNIICPHCANQIEPDEIHENTTMDCERCDGEFSVDVEYTVNYSTSIIGERVTA